MILIDTSRWIPALRRSGDPHARVRVAELLMLGEAAWCDMVLLELWLGCGNAKEREKLREMAAVIPILPTTPEVWKESFRLAELCRSHGKTVPASDLLIAACGRIHGAQVEHADRHFDLIASVG